MPSLLLVLLGPWPIARPHVSSASFAWAREPPPARLSRLPARAEETGAHLIERIVRTHRLLNSVTNDGRGPCAVCVLWSHRVNGVDHDTDAYVEGQREGCLAELQ